MFDIVEIITSLSGEAPIPGFPVLLIRFSGCNLDCRYCDTPYKDEHNLSLSREDLIALIKERIREYPGLQVLLTGGEPLLAARQDEILAVIRELPEIDFYIETNGSIRINAPTPANCHIVADWKTESSGNGTSFYADNLKILKKEKDCIKFVLSKHDFPFVKAKIELIQQLNPGLPIYISPQHHKLKPRQAAEFILKNKLPARLSMQWHKIIWKRKTRGV